MGKPSPTNIHTVCLDELDVGEIAKTTLVTCITAGWARIGGLCIFRFAIYTQEMLLGSANADRLMQLVTPLIADDACRSWYGTRFNPDMHICAGWSNVTNCMVRY